MGLDTSHNCWHGPYSSFNRFRYSLCRQIGINLDEYIGYSEKGTKELLSITHDILPLINHSDCDGKLTVKESRQIVKGINNIIENFKKEIPHDYCFMEDMINFRNGCIDAINKKQQIIFR